MYQRRDADKRGRARISLFIESRLLFGCGSKAASFRAAEAAGGPMRRGYGQKAEVEGEGLGDGMRQQPALPSQVRNAPIYVSPQSLPPVRLQPRRRFVVCLNRRGRREQKSLRPLRSLR